MEDKIKILVLIDVQNDFITGSLANEEAQKVIPNIVKKIDEFDGDYIMCTFDTHTEDYLNTKEGKALPVVHCVKGTDGWLMNNDVATALYYKNVKNVWNIQKPTFGSVENVEPNLPSLPEAIMKVIDGKNKPSVEIEICGFCTDICVVSNALILKAFCYDFADITVDSNCCAGVTPEKHEAALEVMRSCQINVI